MSEVKKAIILIHGYNVSNPGKSVGRLRKPFEALGYKVVMLNYGYWPFTWQITHINPKVAKKLADSVKELIDEGYTVDIAGHSNGCTIVYLASHRYDLEVNTFVAINPALKRDSHPCISAKLVQVWFNGSDMPVIFGKWLRWLTPWARKARPWGEMGMEGYKGKNNEPPVVGFDAGEQFKVKAEGHSAVFERKVRGFFLPRIAVYCRTHRLTVASGDV